MTDIVERLRSDGAMAGYYDVPSIQREAAVEIEWLRGERDRLAADLATAQKAILPWIEQVGLLSARYDIHTDALRRIAHSADYDTIISPDGDRHQQAVEIALEALTEGGR